MCMMSCGNSEQDGSFGVCNVGRDNDMQSEEWFKIWFDQSGEIWEPMESDEGRGAGGRSKWRKCGGSVEGVWRECGEGVETHW